MVKNILLHCVLVLSVDIYYIAPSAPCRAVLMVAKLLSVKLNPKYVDIMTDGHPTPEFLKMNPQHCLPTIDDNGFYLWESRAIMQYLINKYAPNSSLYPQEPQQRAKVDMMLYFDIGTLCKAQGEFFYPQVFRGANPDAEKEGKYESTLSYLETYLTKTSYVAGDSLTLADVSILASLSMMDVLDYEFQDFPKISAWMAKVKKEIPDYETINEQPLREFKALVKAANNQ